MTRSASATSRPGGAFLPDPAQVEQRVVDADGHADQQHHGRGGAVDRHPVRRSSAAGRTCPPRRSRRAAAGCRRRSASRTRPAGSRRSAAGRTYSARLKSSLMPWSTATDRLRSPAWASRTSGWPVGHRVARPGPPRRSWRSAPRRPPATWKVTRPERPSADTRCSPPASSGERTSLTAPGLAQRGHEVFTAPRTPGRRPVAARRIARLDQHALPDRLVAPAGVRSARWARPALAGVGGARVVPGHQRAGQDRDHDQRRASRRWPGRGAGTDQPDGPLDHEPDLGADGSPCGSEAGRCRRVGGRFATRSMNCCPFLKERSGENSPVGRGGASSSPGPSSWRSAARTQAMNGGTGRAATRRP